MNSLKQQLMLLVIGPLILLSLIGSALTITYMKDRALLATNKKAMSDLATGETIIDLMYPGPWNIKNGLLYKGEVRISNNFEAVDRIASLTGDTVTIFLGDTRVSTTVREKTGERAIGSKVSEVVAHEVLKNGQTYLGEADVIGQPTQTAYKPIRDRDGKIIGMFYVGIAKNLSDKLIYESLLTIAAISLGLTIIVAFAAWFFTQRVIIRPLQMITEGTKEFATGHVSNRIKVNSSSEIGELANAFNQMVEAMQNVADRISMVGSQDRPAQVPAFSEEKGEPIIEEKSVTQLKNDELPKGLNESTFKQVLAFIESNDRPMSSEEVGEGVKITRVTARRYLDYLEKIGLVEVELKYGTVGRPEKLYKKVS